MILLVLLAIVIAILIYFLFKKPKATPTFLTYDRHFNSKDEVEEYELDDDEVEEHEVESFTIEDFEAENESLKKYKKKFPFEIRGLQIDEYKKRIIRCNLFDFVSLVKEPDNKYDANAVAVMAPSGLIGYVPREKVEKVHKVLDGGDYLAVLSKIYKANNGYIDASVRIYHNVTFTYKKRQPDP